MNARQKAKYYKQKYEQLANLKIPNLTVTTQHIDTLKCTRFYPEDLIYMHNDEQILKMLKEDLAEEIVKNSDKYVEYEARFEPIFHGYNCTAWLRIASKY